MLLLVSSNIVSHNSVRRFPTNVIPRSSVFHMKESCRSYECHYTERLDSFIWATWLLHMKECNSSLPLRPFVWRRDVCAPLRTCGRYSECWMSYQFANIGHFPQKSHIINGSFEETDLHFKASYSAFAIYLTRARNVCIFHTYISCVKNESCLSYKWVMSLIWRSHVAHMNESSLSV